MIRFELLQENVECLLTTNTDVIKFNGSAVSVSVRTV